MALSTFFVRLAGAALPESSLADTTTRTGVVGRGLPVAPPREARESPGQNERPSLAALRQQHRLRRQKADGTDDGRPYPMGARGLRRHSFKTRMAILAVRSCCDAFAASKASKKRACRRAGTSERRRFAGGQTRGHRLLHIEQRWLLPRLVGIERQWRAHGVGVRPGTTRGLGGQWMTRGRAGCSRRPGGRPLRPRPRARACVPSSCVARGAARAGARARIHPPCRGVLRALGGFENAPVTCPHRVGGMAMRVG